MSLPLPDLQLLGLVALLALLLAGALAPFEALGWWAGWYGEPPEEAPPPERAESARERYLVFLSGIHSVEGETFAGRERNLLARLRERLPNTAIVEVFPYSVTNRALTGQRAFSWFWRWALRMKLHGRALMGMAGMLINARNVWQVAVSADRRYGPIYNQGSAELIRRALLAEGYVPGTGTPVTLVGYSGGGQVAVGAAGPLRTMLDGPLEVVSLGGIVASDPALERIERLHHLVGERDVVQRLSYIVFPGRWPVVPWSSWNQALKAGRIRRVPMGPVDHTGPDGYLDSQATLPDGRTYLESTVDALVGIVLHGDAGRGGGG